VSPSATPGGLLEGRSATGPVARLARRVYSVGFLVRLGAGVNGTLLAFIIVILLGERGVYNLALAAVLYKGLQQGFYVTLELVSYIIPLGFGLGLLVGWARTSHSIVLRGLGGLYVDFFRSLPPLALIVFASLIGALALRPYIVNPYELRSIALWLGATALALHTAAYQAEIVRAGILSVPAGQTEAASAVGLSRARTLFLVTLPQAFRVSLPALGNEFSAVIKDTSLLSAIGFLDLSGLALVEIYSAIKLDIYAPLIIWSEVAAYYFVITFVLNLTVRAVEESFKVPGLGAAAL
jgi:His/Glu/Gln/Arg/opine family amino acid ABC transporter permease subunit